MRSFNHKVIQLVNYRLKSKVAAHRLTLTQDNCITAPPGNTNALTPFIHITIRANSMLDLLTKGVQVARIGHPPPESYLGLSHQSTINLVY